MNLAIPRRYPNQRLIDYGAIEPVRPLQLLRQGALHRYPVGLRES
jgi:hypothetical protein